MTSEYSLFDILGIDSADRKAINKFAKKLRISTSELKHYHDEHILPSGNLLSDIMNITGRTENEIKLKMGCYDSKLMTAIADNSESIVKFLNNCNNNYSEKDYSVTSFKTKMGEVYQEDCIKYLKKIDDEKYDLIFADPPFNLNKLYSSKINDDLKKYQYLNWCETWLSECIRTLKNGGSLFLWNLPKWNSYISEFLSKRLTFRNWIGVDIKYSLPIQGRLYPSHYSLLYYIKGEKPNTFKPDRLPMQTCPHCSKELKDYGGYKNKMNANGINISDIWYDIPPVRHSKYKGRKDANELSIKLLDRIIEMASKEGDVVFDPFGGSGTTFIVSELKNRYWEGCEIGPITDIKNRFEKICEEESYLKKYRNNYNRLFTEEINNKRKQLNLWTPESFITNNSD